MIESIARNWGLGYHLFLAYSGMIWAFMFLRFKKMKFRIIVPAFGLMFVGIGYELYQGKSWDTGQDILANFIGIMLGILTIVIFRKKVINDFWGEY